MVLINDGIINADINYDDINDDDKFGDDDISDDDNNNTFVEPCVFLCGYFWRPFLPCCKDWVHSLLEQVRTTASQATGLWPPSNLPILSVKDFP